ncbi:MAG: PTS sugar transporter subunit IIA [Paracoccaceae bacterium]
MIGLVIVAHDGLADALLAGMEHVVGSQEGAMAIAIGPQDDLRRRQAEIASAVAAVDNGNGVVLVTDMFGGTPSNLAHGALTGPNVEVVYGANLPLLVKLAKMRDRPLPEAVDAAVAAGRKYVNSAGAILETGSQQ